MKITILNSNPDSIKKLMEKFEKQIPRNFIFTPITIEFELLEYHDDLETGTTECITYDFYDQDLVPAEFELEDANLLFDKTRFNPKSLVINGERYDLMKCPSEKSTRKNTPK